MVCNVLIDMTISFFRKLRLRFESEILPREHVI